MKKRLTFFCAFLFFIQFIGKAQCDLILVCDANPYSEVELKVELPEGASVCLEKDLVVSISNNFPSNGREITLQCPINVCLPDDVTYTGGPIGLPAGATIITANPDQVTVQVPSNYFINPGSSLNLTIPVSPGCSWFEEYVSGTASNNSINPSAIDVQTCFTSKLDDNDFCLEKEISVEPRYSVMTPGLCGEVPAVNLGQSFDMPEILVEVTGTDCTRTSFELTVDFSASVNTNNSSIVFMTNGSNYLGTITNSTSNSMLVTFNGVPGLCGSNYPGGLLDDGSLQILGLISESCMTGPVTVEYGINVCASSGNAVCAAAIPQYPTTCSFTSSVVAPQIIVTRTGTGLDFCPQSSIDGVLTYRAENTSANEVAKGVVFVFDAWNSIELNQFSLGFSTPFVGLAAINQLNNDYALPGQNAFVLTGNTLTINSNFIAVDPSAILPFRDLDGDGIFSEMLPGDVVVFQPGLDSKCPFKADACQAEILGQTDLTVNVNYTDQCDLNTLTASNIHTISLSGPQAIFETPFPGPEILSGSIFTLRFCMDDWDQWTGIDGAPYDLGAFQQFLDIEFEYPGLTLLHVRTEGSTPVAINSTFNQPAFSLGQITNPPLSGCFILTFSFNCNPNSLTELMDISVNAYGSWQNCGTQCNIPLGCDEIELYPDVSCFMSTGTGGLPIRECRAVETTDFLIRRTTGSNEPTTAAYACDNGIVILQGEIAPVITNFSGTLTPCFFLPTEYSDVIGGTFNTFLAVGNNTFGLTFAQTVNIDFYGVPHTGFVFESESFNVPQGVNAPVILTINFEFDEDFINNQTEKVEDIPVFGALGRRLQDGSIVKCAALGDQWFQTFKIENEVPALTATMEECDNYFSVPFELNYVGGTDGTDFIPARALNRLVDEFNIEVIGGEGEIIPDGIFANGSFHSFPITDITNLLTSPSLKDGCEGNSQSFDIRMHFLGDCSTDIQSVSIKCDYNVQSESCGTIEPGTVNHTIIFESGSVSTSPVLSTVMANGNCEVLTAQTIITGNSTEYVVHEFYFNPQEVSIQNIGVGVEDVAVISHSPSSSTLVVTTIGNFNPGDILFKEVEVCFLDACEPSPYIINYAAGQSCGLVESGSNSQCLEEGSFAIEFFESDALLNVDQCHRPKEYCENAVITANLQNYTRGDVVNPGLIIANVPSGLQIERAFYRYPFDEANPDCTGPGKVLLTQSELADLQNDGFVVPSSALVGSQPFGNLPGVLSFPDDHERILQFIIEVALCGGDPELIDRTVTVTGIWNKNCGTPDAKTETVNIFGWDNLFDLDLGLSFGDLETSCTEELNTGSILLNTNSAGTDTDLSMGETVTLNLQSIYPALVITSPTLDNNGNVVFTGTVPGQILVEFEMDQMYCDSLLCGNGIEAELSSSVIVDCPFGDLYGTCYTHFEEYDGDFLPFESLPIRSVTLNNACDAILGNETVFIRADFEHCVAAGVRVYFNVYHDTDCDGTPDVLLAQSETISNGPGLDIADLLPIDITSFLQNGEEVCLIGTISTYPDLGCFCASSDGFASNCKDWDLTYTGSFGIYEFTLTGDFNNSNGEFVCATYEVDGTTYTAHSNPFTPPVTLNSGDFCINVQSTRCQDAKAGCGDLGLCEKEACVFIIPETEGGKRNNAIGDFENGQTKTSISPNPFQQDLTVKHYSQIDAVLTLELYNITGQIVFSKVLQVIKGDNELRINLPDNLSSGIFSLVLKGQKGIEFTEKLVHIN